MVEIAGRGGTETFGDFIHRLMQEIARGKLAPDADHQFINELEQLILQRYTNSQPTGATEAGPIPPGLGGQPSPVPVTPIEPLSRGPAPSPDMSGATEELSRIMSGA